MSIRMSQEYKDAFLNNVPMEVSLRVFVDEHTQLLWDETVIVQGSFSLDRSCVAGSNLEIGNVSSAELMFTVNYDAEFEDYEFEGKRIDVNIRPKGESSMVLFGSFIVDEIHRTKTTWTFICLDKMVGLDNVIDRSLFTNSMRASAIIDLIAQSIDATASGTSYFRNSSIELNPLLMEVGATYRDLLSRTLEVLGGNAFLVNDTLFVRWFTVDAEATITEQNRTSSDMQGYPVEITGIRVIEGETTYLKGNEGYVLEITDNPLFTTDNINTILNGLEQSLIGFSYQPYSAEILPMPYLLPCDKVNFVKDGTTYSTIVTNVLLKLNANMRIAGKGESPLAKGYAKRAMTREQDNNMKALEERARLYALTEVEKVSNYFWHDSSGAHVSNAPRDTTGYNTLITSNSVELRNNASAYLKLTADSTSPYILIGRIRDENSNDCRNILLRDSITYFRTGTTSEMRMGLDSGTPFVTVGRTGSGEKNVYVTPASMQLRNGSSSYLTLSADTTSPYVLIGRIKDDNNEDSRNIVIRDRSIYMRTGTTADIRLAYDSTENMPFVTIGRTGEGNRNVFITPLGMSIRTNLTKDARFEYDSTNDTPIIVLGRTGSSNYNAYIDNSSLKLRRGTTSYVELDGNDREVLIGETDYYKTRVGVAKMIIEGGQDTTYTPPLPDSPPTMADQIARLSGDRMDSGSGTNKTSFMSSSLMLSRAGYLLFCDHEWKGTTTYTSQSVEVDEYIGGSTGVANPIKKSYYGMNSSGGYDRKIFTDRTNGIRIFNTTAETTPTLTIGWDGELTAKGCNFTSNKTLTITRTENSYVNATSIGRLYAYERSGFLWLNGNFQITTAMPTSSDFIEVATISGWSGVKNCFATIPMQNGTGCVTVQITTSGSVQIYNGTSGNISGFARMSMSAPKS